jgi:3D (Asp-Asp-Asp) domain-containing protein
VKSFILSIIIACSSMAADSAQGDWRSVTVTAYCACPKCCGKHSDGITANGSKATEGVTAAASRSIPFGTRIWIPGAGWRIVQDRLAKRFDARMDLFFASHKAAIKWGKQTLLVFVSK